MATRRVLITGSGAICGAGNSPAAIFSTVAAGSSAIRPISQWDSTRWPANLAAEVADYNAAALTGDRDATVASLREYTRFDSPGVRETAPGRYEVVLIGQMWSFTPNEIRVPAGSQHGDTVRLKHRGMPRVGGGGSRGDRWRGRPRPRLRDPCRAALRRGGSR